MNQKVRKIYFIFLVFFLFSCASVDLNLKDFSQVKEPSINGALIFGVRPGHPVLFKVAISGQLPMDISVENLPSGLSFDKQLNTITGVLASAGDYVVGVRAKNQLGEDFQKITFRCGETISLTPPMGWNSWYCYSESVSSENIRLMARAMKSSGLANFGWTYINIDDCWQGVRGGKYNAIQGNARFPDMKEMVDDVHALGLKIGIYSTPWISTYAGFIGGSSDNEEGSVEDIALLQDKRPQETQFFGRWPGLHSLGLDRFGKYWLCDKDAMQWAEWGFDYVKFDWKPNDVPTTKRIYGDLRNSGRDMVLSLSNAAPIADAVGLAENSNLWRTTGDIHDSWASVSMIVNQHLAWAEYQSPGHWNDPDMLQVGNIGVPNTFVTSFKPTGLSKNQQVSQVSYWAMFSAPLLLSCNLEDIDDFTIRLLTNKNIIAINQDGLGIQGRVILENSSLRVLKKDLAGGRIALAVFNKSGMARIKNFDIAKFGISPDYSCIDAWSDEEVNIEENLLEVGLGGHSARVYIFSK
ncbi:MAG: hypothetical protein JXR63_06110 [Spirochaetales bacterium]|nr:hypothetical protein [Spirochaetales bacterium]